MNRSSAAATALAVILVLAGCTPTPAPTDPSAGSSTSPAPAVEPIDDPQAPASPRDLAAFRRAAPELDPLSLEAVPGLTVQQNDRLWILGASGSPDAAAAIRVQVLELFGEFPETDGATAEDGTVNQVVGVVDDRAMDVTLNDLGGGAFLLYVLLSD